ncbi:hypothetical protein MKW92_004356 [Papaver armeniacum]|nr:hypothetical protein MKW92_004356 [Papaver armeniacum]
MSCFSCIISPSHKRDIGKIQDNSRLRRSNSSRHSTSNSSESGQGRLSLDSNEIVKRRATFNGRDKERSIPSGTTARSFTFRELVSATKNFKITHLIGEGGFGKVYKGCIETGEIVAVKQLAKNSLQGNQEFIVEVLMLSLLHHPNLVNLIGYCTDGDQRLLVYEYMAMGSLQDHLFDLSSDEDALDWNTRMKIAVGAARGLEHLHCTANPPARQFLTDRKKYIHLADPLLKGQFPLRSFHHAAYITSMCLQEQPNFRPMVRDIVVALEYLASQPYKPETSDTAVPRTTPPASPFRKKKGNSLSREPNGTKSSTSI